VECRIGSPTALTGIYSAYSYMEIQQINIVSPVIQDPSRVYAYVSPPLILTVAGQAGWTTVYAKAVFLKLSDGSWRMVGNISGTQTAGTSGTLTITGVVFKSVGAAHYQPVTSMSGGSNAVVRSYATPNANTIYVSYEANYAGVYVSFDVELESKPTVTGIPTDI
jgi:hypothetical protein